MMGHKQSPCPNLLINKCLFTLLNLTFIFLEKLVKITIVLIFLGVIVQ